MRPVAGTVQLLSRHAIVVCAADASAPAASCAAKNKKKEKESIDSVLPAASESPTAQCGGRSGECGKCGGGGGGDAATDAPQWPPRPEMDGHTLAEYAAASRSMAGSGAPAAAVAVSLLAARPMRIGKRLSAAINGGSGGHTVAVFPDCVAIAGLRQEDGESLEGGECGLPAFQLTSLFFFWLAVAIVAAALRSEPSMAVFATKSKRPHWTAVPLLGMHALVCAHASRDSRCGKHGPVVAAAIAVRRSCPSLPASLAH
jgi:hypothetical protein